MNKQLLQQAKELYSGFYIERPVGNNAFSFELRKRKRIYVPPLIEGTVDDVQLGSKIVFVEVEEDREQARKGLKNFVYWQWQDKPVFIFDNHNHAFFFWLLAYQAKLLKRGSFLLHVDQHTDMWKPPYPPTFSLKRPLDLNNVFFYTNYVLNVGSFIKPAQELGLFTETIIINTFVDFDQTFRRPLILDLDLDIFAPELKHPDRQYKIQKIQKWLKWATVITIATSPFFIEQSLALTLLQEIFRM